MAASGRRRQLLVVQAHPDDESFICGGTLARASAEGVEVTILCFTRGDAGKLGNPPVGKPGDLPEIREAELRQAAALLGVYRVEVFDYRDRRMEAADGVKADRERGIALIRDWMERLAARGPLVVVSFPPGGLSGHSDHKVCHRWTRDAFLATFGREGGGPGPLRARLYYWTWDARWPRARGRAIQHPLDVTVSARIDVTGFVDRKIAAIRAHKSQHLAIGKIFGEFTPELRAALGKEAYYRAAPPWEPGAPEETDLWQGF